MITLRFGKGGSRRSADRWLKFLGVAIGALLVVTAFALLNLTPAHAASSDRKFGTGGSTLIKAPVRRKLAYPSCAAGRSEYFVAAKAFPSRSGIFDPIGTVVTKLRSDGRANRRFGRSGKINLRGRHEIHEMLPAENGSVVLLQRMIEKVQGGYQGRGWRLLKFDRNGRRDRLFGDRGAVDLGDFDGIHPSQLSVRRLDDGRLVVIVNSNQARELMLFTRRGAPASNFGSQGSLTGPVTITSVAINTKQGIWIGGNSTVAPVVQKLTSNGTVDRSFDIPAAPSSIVGTNTAYLGPAVPIGVTVRSDGTILVVLKQPHRSKYYTGIFWAVSLAADGTLNQSWGDGGFRYLYEYASEDLSAALVESLRSGRMLIAADPFITSTASRTKLELVDSLGRDSKTFTLSSRSDTAPDFDVDEAGLYLVSCGMHAKSVRVKRVRL